MKKLLFVAVMLLFTISIFAADYPVDADAVQEYLYAKLGSNTVSRTTISTNSVDAMMCLQQYQACKDERAMLRILTRHIAIADELMKNKSDIDGQRGLLIAYSALKCANLYLKDKTLATGIAIGMIQPNINFASDDFNSDNGKIYIANEILDAARAIDNDDAIVKAFDLLIILTKKYPNTADAYHIKYAFYLSQHTLYSKALEQLDAMTVKSMVLSAAKLRSDIAGKLNKAVN